MMHKRIALLLGIAFLTGCGGEPETQSKAVDDARDVAMVERMNQPPFRPIRPEPFTPADIAQYDLARAGCMFRPGERPDEAPLFIAQQDRGYMKIEGKLQPLSVRTDSAELPSGAHSTYIGTAYWVELVAQAGSAANGPTGQKAWPSRFVIRDANERVAFNALGQVRCVARSGEPAARVPEGSASDEA